jgi:signal transduction histidine kinase
VERTRGTWAPFAVLVAGAVGLGLIFAAGSSRYDPGWQLALAAATGAIALVVAALAWMRFREPRDPHELFLTAGFGVIALQTIWFDVWWPIAHGPRAGFFAVTVGTATTGPAVRFSGGPAPVYAWQFGWAVAGCAFVLGAPWWERRGRAPLRPSWVLGISALVLIGGDLLLIATTDTRTIPYFGSVPGDATLGVTGPLHWILGIVAIGLLGTAAAREWDRRPPRGWLSAAFLLAASLQVAVLAHPTPGLPFLRLEDIAGPVVPVLAFVWLLHEQGTASSRSRRAEDRAEAVLAGRAEIASMIAHEVRGPVATVRGIAATSLAHYDRLSEAERREFLTMIEQESVQLLSAVDQMALGLKVDAGTLRFDLGPVDLGEVVKAATGEVERGGRLVAVVAETGVLVHADPSRLREAVRQLVENAVKFSPLDAPVTVRAVREGDVGLVEIADEGPGIPAERRLQVVERFPSWRPPGYEDRPGTGLGLFIATRLLTGMGGGMSIEDGPHGGTMLRVRIPLEG